MLEQALAATMHAMEVMTVVVAAVLVCFLRHDWDRE